MNRRTLMTAAAASVVLPGAVKAGEGRQSVHPDANLLAACAAHDDLERAYLATGFDHEIGMPEYDAAEVEQERITAAQKPYVDRICEIRPVTWEGHVARARTLALCDPDLFRRAADYTNEAMLAAIVRDLIGEGGASRPSVVPEMHTRTNAKKVEQQADTRGRLLANSAELSTWEGVAHG